MLSIIEKKKIVSEHCLDAQLETQTQGEEGIRFLVPMGGRDGTKNRLFEAGQGLLGWTLEEWGCAKLVPLVK